MAEDPGPNWHAPRLRAVELDLPPELRSQFRSLVEDTHFHAVKRGWCPLRQWVVFADLIREGWRGPKYSGAPGLREERKASG